MITYVTSGRFGAWQGTCRFHAKNNKTGCKRRIAVQAPGGDVERELALGLVQHWLNKHRHYDRQRRHLRLMPTPGMLPCFGARLAEQPGDPRRFRTDEDIDAELGVSDSDADQDGGDGDGGGPHGPRRVQQHRRQTCKRPAPVQDPPAGEGRADSNNSAHGSDQGRESGSSPTSSDDSSDSSSDSSDSSSSDSTSD